MIDIGISFFNFGVMLYFSCMFFSLCEPANKYLPQGVYAGFVMVLIGGFLSGEMHL